LIWRLPDQQIKAESRFERLILPHLDAAYTLARYLINDASDAEDVVQESILRAVQYFGTLRNDSDARAWLLTIVRRECFTAWSHRDKRMDSVSLDTLTTEGTSPRELVDRGETPDLATGRSLLREKIVGAVAQLPGHLREIVVLRELQQLSYEEIAVITESPIGTVMSRVSRARTRLAESLRGVVDVGELS
jgi:RNA polymerase sigma factor (sigma-70 family)